MKRILFSLACLMISIGIFAQGPIQLSAKFAKGSFATYTITSETSMNSPLGGEPIKVNNSSEVKYTVTEVRKDGYTIEATILSIENSGSLESIGDEGFSENLINIFTKQWVGKKVALLSDKDGKILHIKNFEEIKSEMTKAADEFISTLSNEKIEGASLSRDMIRELLISQLTEEKMISTITAKVFDYYGKSYMTGMMEDVEVEKLKAKNTYVVSAPKNSNLVTINTAIVIAMSKEELKDVIVKELQEKMPDQLEAILPQIDQLIESGMVKIDGNGKTNCVFKKDSWLQNMESSMTINTMGVQTEVVSKTTLKESK